VRPLLRDAGHDVFTPALTGLGERAHLGDPATDLDTHITDVVAVLHYEDLRDVVLVGHSYGGMVITGAADRAADRLAHLVYLDADVPRDGQSEFDLMPREECAGYEEAARLHGDGWRIPPPLPGSLPPGTPAAVAWTVERMVGHPLRTLTQPLRLTRPDGAGVPRTYVLCTEGKDGQDVPTDVQRIAVDPEWRLIELHADHAAHVTAPEALAATLLEIAAA
jgi:pimeloyl-ACP methyl ester carboxylesterase